ncbi:Leucine-rich repeat containing protein [Entamoeba marina]
MSKLEIFYLANVMLYFDSCESVVKFCQINKKCDEVRKMLRITPNIRRLTLDSTDKSFNKMDILFYMKRSLNEYLSTKYSDLFPNINTVVVEGKEIEQYYKELIHIDNVILYDLPRDMNLMEPFFDRIVEFNWVYNNTTYFQLHNFKFMKICRIDCCCNDIDIKILFPEQNQRLKLLRFSNVVDYSNLMPLEHYQNIDNIVIDVDNEINHSDIKSLSLFAKLCAKSFNSSKPNIISLQDNKLSVEIIEKPSNHLFKVLNQQYYPFKLELHTIPYDELQDDLLQFPQLQRIDIQNILNENQNDNIIQQQISLPTKISSLSVCQSSPVIDNIAQLPLKKLYFKDISMNILTNCHSLTKLTLIYVNLTQPLSMLTHLVDISFDCCKNKLSKDITIYPSSLKNLHIANCKYWPYSQLIQLNELTSLLISDHRVNHYTSLNLGCLSTLKRLCLNNVLPNVLPTAITQVIIENIGGKTIDLKGCSSLKQCCIGNSLNVSARVPTTLTSLYLSASTIQIENGDIIKLKELHLSECNNHNFEQYNLQNITKLSIFPFEEQYSEQLKLFTNLSPSNFN